MNRSVLLSLSVLGVLGVLGAGSDPAAAVPGGVASSAGMPPSHARVDDLEEEFERRLEEAGDDVDLLWELVGWCDDNDLDRNAEKVAKKVVKLDENHRPARERLGHIRYDDQWFESERDLEKYKEKELERRAREEGLVKWKGEWVHPDDVPFLEEGLVKAPDGTWVTPEELEKIEAGWVRQDLVWVSPDEAAKIDEGLWKCGDDWLSVEDANEYHARLSRPWLIPSTHFLMHTTCDREVADGLVVELESAWSDFSRIFGTSPTEPVEVMVVRSLDQYNTFSSEDPFGLSSLYGGYFALHWIDERERHVHNAGVAYRPENDEYDYGRLYARYALGHSVVQAIDGSPKTIDKFRKSSRGEFDVEAFFEERQLPDWFRYGAATYVSRYFLDRRPGANATWTREWSVQNIQATGGLDELDDVFGFEMSLDSEAGFAAARKMLNESGLLVAFCLDGEAAEVRHAHAAVKDALRKGKGVERAFRDLEEAIADHEDELRAFAGL